MDVPLVPAPALRAPTKTRLVPPRVLIALRAPIKTILVPLRVLIALRAPIKTILVPPRVLIALPVPPTRGFKVTPLPQSVSLALLVNFQLPVPLRVLIALRAPTKIILVPPRVLIALPVPPTRGFKVTPLPQSVSLALLVNFQLPVPPRVLIAPLERFQLPVPPRV